MTSILWFRRDLRTLDNPALSAAAKAGNVVPVFVLDPKLWDTSGPPRQLWLARSLQHLSDSLAGNLNVVAGIPSTVIPQLAELAKASSVHISRDYGTYGQRRDQQVGQSLSEAGRRLVTTGSSYAVDPGSVTTGAGSRYRVFTPFYRSWVAHGWERPDPGADAPVDWQPVSKIETVDLAVLAASVDCDIEIGPVGQQAALTRWEWFAATELVDYAQDRNRPDLDGTSKLSAHLRWGEIHPRTLLAALAQLPADQAGSGAEVYRKELAWREFYAEVWAANPRSTSESLDPRFDVDLEVDSGPLADERFAAWTAGRTGFPIVDAGMRQLRATGWMHNRVRMITASFLIKDLHLPWQRGAQWFMRWLKDGDAASNQHGWQWVAGCGTDAAPFYRIFNPVRQGLNFDPDGDYVRQWIPELADLPGPSAHEPWLLAGTLNCPPDFTYPDRIVDHQTERDQALARHAALPPRGL